jgi:hypothetical protein
MSWPYQFKQMTLDEFRNKITYFDSLLGDRYYSCPMCGASGPVKGLRQRHADYFGVSKSSLDFIEDVELIYRSCIETQRRYPAKS